MAAIAHTTAAVPRALRRWTTWAVISAIMFADMPRVGDRPRVPHVRGDAPAGGSLDAPGDVPAATDPLVTPDNARVPDRRAHRAGPSSVAAPGSARSPRREYARSIIGL